MLCCSCAAPVYGIEWVKSARLAYVSDGELPRLALDAALETLVCPLLSSQAPAVDSALRALQHFTRTQCNGMQ